eukprot:547763-Amphidinium_carterae.1
MSQCCSKQLLVRKTENREDSRGGAARKSTCETVPYTRRSARNLNPHAPRFHHLPAEGLRPQWPRCHPMGPVPNSRQLATWPLTRCAISCRAQRSMAS